MSQFGIKTVINDTDKIPSFGEQLQEKTLNRPEDESWDKVEDSIECAISTLESAIHGTVYRKNKSLSTSLRRLYNRSKRLRLARGKILLEDKQDEENFIDGSCMLGEFINGVY